MVDNGGLPESAWEECFGENLPVEIEAGYASWWITASPEGMTTLIYHCLKDSGVSKKQIIDYFVNRTSELANVAREIESISVPSVGNG